MSNDNLGEFEQNILDSVENNEWQSKGNIQERLAELQGFLKHEKKRLFQSGFQKMTFMS